MITNKYDLPQPLVDAVMDRHHYKPNRYSVTEVLGGTCEAILKRRHEGEGEEDVSERIWALFGTAVHEVLRKAKATDSQLQENWMSVQVGDTGYELSGIFDLYDGETKTVTDYKTASTWRIRFRDFDDWRRQTLLYCWMLRQLGFEAENGEVVAFLKDHSKREARLRASEGYPPLPVFKKVWHFGAEDFDRAERYLKEWFGRVAEEERKPTGNLRPCSPEQRWHKPDRWAVMRRGQRRAVRLFDTEEEATGYMGWLANQPSNKGKPLYIESRPGENTKCEGYCSVAQFCPYHRAAHETE